MHFSTPFLLLSTLLSTTLAAQFYIPTDSRSTVIQAGDKNLRLYYPTTDGRSIVELSIDPATGTVLATGNIPVTGAPVRSDSSLAAVFWIENGSENIRIYYVTDSNTTGELAFTYPNWNRGADLGFAVSATADQVNAIRVGTGIQVAYTRPDGSLFQVVTGNGVNVWYSRPVVSK